MFEHWQRRRTLREQARRLGQLEERYESTGALDDLERAIELREDMIAAVSTVDVPAAFRFNLSHALRLLHERTGRPDVLDGAVTHATAAVHAVGADADRAAYLSHLGVVLRLRYEQTRDRDDLARAIENGRAAVSPDGDDHPDRPQHLGELSMSLQARYLLSRDDRDLDEVIRLDREVVAVTGGRDAAALSHLSIALRMRYERTGDHGTLDEAIACSSAATAPRFTDHPSFAAHTAALALALDDLYERDGALGDLDRAIRAYRIAVDATPRGQPLRATYLGNLAVSLRHRHERTHDTAASRGASSDLDEAIAVHRQAVQLTPPGHARRAVRLSNLAAALVDRAVETDAIADMDEAVEVARRAVDADGDDPDPTRLSGLAVALRLRSTHDGGDGNLADALTHLGRAAASLPDDHPHLVTLHHNHGVALLAQHEHTGDVAILERAVDAFRSSARTTSGPLLGRAVSARLWGVTAHRSGDAALAADGFSLAVDLARRLAPMHLDRNDQESRLAQVSGLGQDAAAACVDARRPRLAVELFDQSRAVLLSQALAGRRG